MLSRETGVLLASQIVALVRQFVSSTLLGDATFKQEIEGEQEPPTEPPGWIECRINGTTSDNCQCVRVVEANVVDIDPVTAAGVVAGFDIFYAVSQFAVFSYYLAKHKQPGQTASEGFLKWAKFRMVVIGLLAILAIAAGALIFDDIDNTVSRRDLGLFLTTIGIGLDNLLQVADQLVIAYTDANADPAAAPPAAAPPAAAPPAAAPPAAAPPAAPPAAAPPAAPPAATPPAGIPLGPMRRGAPPGSAAPSGLVGRRSSAPGGVGQGDVTWRLSQSQV